MLPAEIKHGRVSMLAVAGYLGSRAGTASGNIGLPGIFCIHPLNGFTLPHLPPTGTCIVAFIGFLELAVSYTSPRSSPLHLQRRYRLCWDTF
jgi:hypothetical protein